MANNLNFDKAVKGLDDLPAERAGGKLVGITGLTMEVVGCKLSIGERCEIEGEDGERILAEVVGFQGSRTFLMPFRQIHNVAANAPVRVIGRKPTIPIGRNMLGRIFDGLMQPLDDMGEPDGDQVSLKSPELNPLKRRPITEPLDVGVRAINGMLTTGKGQRIGLFAGAGLGKSVLLGMITRYTKASIVVVGLIGERGREVREFIEDELGPEGRKRAIVIAAPADQSPLMRIRAAETCHRIAEHFRDQGEDVLLLMDSFTRYAQAKRELALSVGEPPATKGYPPSIFAALTRLAERSGNSESEGSMTAIYTVLAEGDDQQDPIADAARAILDGHIILSRELAESGHYPAIDVPASISRVMTRVTTPEHQDVAKRMKKLLSKYDAVKELMPLGAYEPGNDPETDEAVQRKASMDAFLQQKVNEQASLEDSLSHLNQVFM